MRRSNGPLGGKREPESVIKRRDRMEEEETGVAKVPNAKWTDEENDLVLDHAESGTLDMLKYKLPDKTIRARRIRVQHLASREREYRPSPTRTERRSGSKWSSWDTKVFLMGVTPAAIRNGTNLEYLAAVLGRHPNEIPKEYQKLFKRAEEKHASTD